MPMSDPSARALGRIVQDFAPFDTLLLVARLPDSLGTEPQPLEAFVQRLEQTIAADAALRESIRDIRSIRGASSAERTYFETQVIPAGLYYLNDIQFEQFMQRLTPERAWQFQVAGVFALAVSGFSWWLRFRS